MIIKIDLKRHLATIFVIVLFIISGTIMFARGDFKENEVKDIPTDTPTSTMSPNRKR